jgi:predicted tellurium resistance membrane protein TerC
LRLLDRFPGLETSAYLLVGWIGAKLFLETFDLHLPPWLFWGVMLVLFAAGFVKWARPAKEHPREEIFEEVAEDQPEDSSPS